MECHLWLIRDVLRDMVKRNEGQIVSIASMAGLASSCQMGDYCAAKHGAVGLMESLRLEMKLANKKIVCTTICPYMIDTGMFDGCKDSWIYPFLKMEYVVWRVVMATLQNEEEVTIPWSMGCLTYLGKAMFPSAVCDYIIYYLMGWDNMSSFKGRDNSSIQKKQN